MADQHDAVVEYWQPRRAPAAAVWLVAGLGGLAVLASAWAVQAAVPDPAVAASAGSGDPVTAAPGTAATSGPAAAATAAATPSATVSSATATTTASPSPRISGSAVLTGSAAGVAGSGATATLAPDEITAQLADLPPLAFREGSVTLTAEGYEVVTRIARLVERSGDARFAVAAHTDSEGLAADNDDLSRRRAQAVVEALALSGIDPDRLDAYGYGERRPLVTPEVSDADREANRRVEVVLLE